MIDVELINSDTKAHETNPLMIDQLDSLFDDDGNTSLDYSPFNFATANKAVSETVGGNDGKEEEEEKLLFQSKNNVFKFNLKDN